MRTQCFGVGVRDASSCIFQPERWGRPSVGRGPCARTAAVSSSAVRFVPAALRVMWSYPSHWLKRAITPLIVVARYRSGSCRRNVTYGIPMVRRSLHPDIAFQGIRTPDQRRQSRPRWSISITGSFIRIRRPAIPNQMIIGDTMSRPAARSAIGAFGRNTRLARPAATIGRKHAAAASACSLEAKATKRPLSSNAILSSSPVIVPVRRVMFPSSG